MKIRAGEPGAHGASVLLDGNIVRDCVSADEEGGFVEVYRRDLDARHVTKENRGAIVVDRLTGSVQVFLTEAAWIERVAGHQPQLQLTDADYERAQGRLRHIRAELGTGIPADLVNASVMRDIGYVEGMIDGMSYDRFGETLKKHGLTLADFEARL